jgi:hypothetical protein
MTVVSDVAGDNRRSARGLFRKAAQAAAVGCATFLICAALFRAAVHPSLLRCSPWIIPVSKGAWAPAWIMAPMVALWVVSTCFGAVRWGWLARQLAGNARRGPSRTDFTLTIDFGWRLFLVIAASALFSAAPILVALASC